MSLDPPLVETLAAITGDPATLSPGVRSMIELLNQHMRMLHDQYTPSKSRTRPRA